MMCLLYAPLGNVYLENKNSVMSSVIPEYNFTCIISLNVPLNVYQSLTEVTFMFFMFPGI